MNWLGENMGNIIVIVIVLVMVFLAVRSIVKNRKNGSCSCGGNCGCCGMAGKCHAGKKNVKESLKNE